MYQKMMAINITLSLLTLDKSVAIIIGAITNGIYA